MESPDVFVLTRVHWQFFGTLTFKKELMPERHRIGMYFATLRTVARKLRVFFPDLPWCLRQENGEQFGRRHLHFLLTGLPRNNVNPSTCFFIMHSWEEHGGGMARVRVFDDTLNGVGYVSKCLGTVPDGRDVYESAKFAHGPSQLMLSSGLQRMLRGLDHVTERRLAQ